MIATIRAGLAVLMLAGFYLLALAQLVAIVAFGGWLSTFLPGPLALKLLWPLLAAAVGAVAVALWRAIRSKPEPPEGLPITPAEAPHLWDTMRGLAAEVGTRVPDEIRIVPDVNAAVVEQSRLMGLVGGPRYLYLGVPLLQGLSVAQLHAVIAHEFGHYSHRHTRLGAVAYRGRMAIAGALERIGRSNPVGWAFKGYARLYLLVDHAVVRRQELEADRAAVWVAGRAAAGSALREVHVIAAAWHHYFSRYVQPGWASGYAPEDIFDGFRHLLAGRRDELDQLRQTIRGESPSRWDTHPPLADRLAAISTAPVRGVAVDDRPAGVLLPGLDVICRRLQAAMLDLGGRTVLSWPELTARVAGEATERAAGDVLAALERVVGGTAPLSPDTLLDLVESGRMAELAQPMFPTAARRELPALLADRLVPMLALAALRSGAAQWRHSWSSGAELVVAGEDVPLELAEPARLAVVPETVARARRRLTALGVDLAKPLKTTEAPKAPTPSDTRDQIVGGIADIKVDGVAHDLIVLDTGLVLIANPDQSDTMKRRLTRLVQSRSVSELVQEYWFIRYDEIAHARIIKNVPIHAELTLPDGRRLSLVQRWTSAKLTKDSEDQLLRLLATISSRRPVPEQGGSTEATAGRVHTPVSELEGSMVLDGLANIKVNDVPYDLLVLDIGLVLIADPGPFERGRERLTALVSSQSAAEIAAGHWLIRYEEIVGARIIKEHPVRAELELWEGQRVALNQPWHTQELTDQARQVLGDALRSVGATVG